MEKGRAISVGEFIIRLRYAKQLTQDELAFRCSFSRSHMSNLELDKTLPDDNHILALAIALETIPSEFTNLIGAKLDEEYYFWKSNHDPSN